MSLAKPLTQFHPTKRCLTCLIECPPTQVILEFRSKTSLILTKRQQALNIILARILPGITFTLAAVKSWVEISARSTSLIHSRLIFNKSMNSKTKTYNLLLICRVKRSFHLSSTRKRRLRNATFDRKYLRWSLMIIMGTHFSRETLQRPHILPLKLSENKATLTLINKYKKEKIGARRWVMPSIKSHIV